MLRTLNREKITNVYLYVIIMWCLFGMKSYENEIDVMYIYYIFMSGFMMIYSSTNNTETDSFPILSFPILSYLNPSRPILYIPLL